MNLCPNESGAFILQGCRRTDMLTTYRFRIYPTKTEARLMNETLETCRLLFNDMLADRRKNRRTSWQRGRGQWAQP
jgi:hypothetical protein